MSGYESKKAMSHDKFTDTVEVDLQMIMIQALKDLNLKVENLKSRVEVMEKYQRDDGK